MKNVALVGCGFVAQQCHLPTFSSNSEIRIKYIADPIVDLREDIAKKYNIPYQYNSHKDLLDIEDIDLFVITLPRKLTYHVVKDIYERGYNILTEKPLCLNSQNGEHLLDIAQNHDDAFICVGYMKQHDKGMIRFKELVGKQKLETIHGIRAYCYMGDSYASPFGDIKGKDIRDIKYKEEEFPSWLPEKYYWGFEQFINVFSHTTHSIEFLFEGKINLDFANVNENGEGYIMGSIRDIPLIFDFMRGNQYEWREGIEVNGKENSFKITFPPAFLRNVPAEITSRRYDHDKTIISSIKSDWSWAFKEQADRVISYLYEPDQTKFEHLERAVSQVKFAEELFKRFIIS